MEQYGILSSNNSCDIVQCNLLVKSPWSGISYRGKIHIENKAKDQTCTCNNAYRDDKYSLRFFCSDAILITMLKILTLWDGFYENSMHRDFRNYCVF